MSHRDIVLSRQGAALRAWRQAAEISQTAAAERIGATQSTWASWELGRKAPDAYYAGRVETLTEGTVVASEWAYPRVGTAAAREADAAESGTDVSTPSKVA